MLCVKRDHNDIRKVVTGVSHSRGVDNYKECRLKALLHWLHFSDYRGLFAGKNFFLKITIPNLKFQVKLKFS